MSDHAYRGTRFMVSLWIIGEDAMGARGLFTAVFASTATGFFVAGTELVAAPAAAGTPPAGRTLLAAFAGSAASKAARDAATAKMGSLESDPWSEARVGLKEEAARILKRLRDEGDELETRRAWLEELAEQVICPVCDGEVHAVISGQNCTLKCSHSKNHINWP